MDKIKIKNSTINVSINLCGDSAIKREVERFDLASKTPFDCMTFIKLIKQKIRDGIL